MLSSPIALTTDMATACATWAAVYQSLKPLRPSTGARDMVSGTTAPTRTTNLGKKGKEKAPNVQTQLHCPVPACTEETDMHSSAGNREHPAGAHQGVRKLLQQRTECVCAPPQEAEPARVQGVQQGRQQLHGDRLQPPQGRRAGALLDSFRQREDEPGHRYAQLGLGQQAVLSDIAHRTLSGGLGLNLGLGHLGVLGYMELSCWSRSLPVTHAFPPQVLADDGLRAVSYCQQSTRFQSATIVSCKSVCGRLAPSTARGRL